MCYDRHMIFQTATRPRCPAWYFVAHEVQYTVTASRAFRWRKRRCTLLVLWAPASDLTGVTLWDCGDESRWQQEGI